MVFACAALALFAGCKGAPVKRPDGGAGLLPVGALAPDVRAKDASGREVTLSGARGHAAVVYFYPRDGTPGCTKEACAFRDAWDRYVAAGVVVLGVSRDSEESHRAFMAEHRLPFALASDESGALERAYGVPSTLGLTRRVTFLVSGDGRVAQVWPDVDPGVHASDVLDTAKKLGVVKGGE